MLLGWWLCLLAWMSGLRGHLGRLLLGFLWCGAWFGGRVGSRLGGSLSHLHAGLDDLNRMRCLGAWRVSP